jgi:hypothetical protein
MAQDSSLPVRRAGLTHLKGDAAVTAVVPAASIYPGTAGSVPSWPFVRWGPPSAIPIRSACVDGSEIAAAFHAFAKPRYVGSALVESAEDHVARIGAAITRSLDRQRLVLDASYPGTALWIWRNSQLMQDGAEADAWHWIGNFRVRVIS